MGLVLTAATFVASCSDENGLAPKSGEEATVTFTTQLPTGVDTRAFADGKTAQTLHYAVYDANDDSRTPLAMFNGQKEATQTINLSTTVSLQLTTGKTYDVVFFADATTGSPYTFNANGQTVDVAYAPGATPANDESRDAFYKKVRISVVGNQTETVTLTRPFAQLNIGADDIAAASASGFTATKAEVKAVVGNKLNLFDGTIEGETEQTFELAAIPNGEDFPVEPAKYDYLAMNYLLVPDAKCIRDVKFKVTDAGTQSIERTFANVPLQRNYRTNIYGSLLTNAVDVNVVIEPSFETPDYNVTTNSVMLNGKLMATFNDAVAEANANPGTDYTIDLIGNTEWATGNAGGGANPMFTNDGQTITINGGGKAFVATGHGGIRSKAKMVFNNTTIVDKTAYLYESGETAWEFTYLEFEQGDYVFNNCTFENSVMFCGKSVKADNCTFNGKATLASNQSREYCVWVYNGTAEFLGCTFSNGYRGVKICDYYEGVDVTSVVFDGCTFKDLSEKPGVEIDNIQGELTVAIRNCTFQNCQNGADGKPIYGTTGVVPTLENNTIAMDGITWDGKSTYNISSAIGLKTAGEKFFAKGGTFNIADDIDMAGVDYKAPNVNGVNEFILNGNDHKISNLTMTTTKYDQAGDEFGGGLLARLASSGTILFKDLTMENCTFTSSATAEFEQNAIGAFMGWFETHGGTATLSNCHVKGMKAVINDQYIKYVGGLLGYASSNTVNINGCSVENSQLTGFSHVGAFVGLYSNGKIDNSVVSGNTIVSTVKNRGGAIVGTAQKDVVFGAITVNGGTVNGAASSLGNLVGSVDNRADKGNSGVTIK